MADNGFQVTRSKPGRFDVVTKIGISTIFGLLAFGISTLIDSHVGTSVIVGVAVSAFVGGVAFITQFLMEVDERLDTVGRGLQNLESRYARLEGSYVEHVAKLEGSYAEHVAKLEGSYTEHVDATSKLIRDEFTKINDATKLFGLVEASALKTDAMTQLVKNSTSIPQGTPPLVFDFAQGEIARLSGYLKELGQGGDVTYEGEDRDWLLGLTKVATSTIDATSLTTVDAGGRGFVDGGLWSSDLGHHYLEAQREAIRRGVQIRRIFILDRPDLQNDADLTSILNDHVAIGVNVRILRPIEVIPAWRAALFDFIVIDGALSYQPTAASRTNEQGRPVIITTTLVTNGTRVQERIERFKDLWDSASVQKSAVAPVVTGA
jgi:hypothetical protein